MKNKGRVAWILLLSLFSSFLDTNSIGATESSSTLQEYEEEDISVSFQDGVLTFEGSGEIECPSTYTESEWYPYREQTKKIILDDGIIDIGDAVFKNFSSLEEIVWPNQLRSLGSQCFVGCTSLKKVTLPDGISQWGWMAFANCTSLEEVEIGNCKCAPAAFSLQTGNLFYGDTSLKKITVSEQNKYFLAQDNVLYYNYGESDLSHKAVLVSYPLGNDKEEFHVPDFVQKIGDGAFSHSQHLKKVSMSDSVTFLGVNAFSDMLELREIQFSDSLNCINNSVCNNCEKLEKVILPENVKEIDGNTFSHTNLRVLTLPASVEIFDVSSLNYCTNLKKIIAYNPNMEICGEPYYTNFITTFCGYRDSSMKSYVVENEDNYNIQFEELKSSPIEVSQEILEHFEVVVDGDKWITEADTLYDGNDIQLRRKSDSEVVAVDINDNELCYVEDGIINYSVDKPIRIGKAFIQKKVGNLEEFLNIFQEDNSHVLYSLEEDIHFTGGTDLGATREQEFSGVLEGNNHCIVIDDLSGQLSTKYTFSLFHANYGIWKNVKVQYGSVNLPYYTFRGLCQYNYGVIEKCNILGEIAAQFCYGICSENKGVIKNSVVDCEIAAKTEAYGITKSNSNMLYNNIVKGNLVVSYGEAASMVSYGSMYSKIENCTNYANITAKRAAGIIDYNYGDVINCNNYGIVKGTEVEGDILIGNTEQKVPTASPSPTPSPTPTVKPTASPSPTPTATPTPTASPSPTPTATPTPTANPSPTPTAKPTPTASPSPTPTAKPTPTASPSPTPTVTPTASPSPTPTVKPTAIPSPTPTVKPTAIPSPTPVIVPDIVKTVKAIKTSNNNVRLSWNKLGKCHYQIWRSEGGNHKYQLLIQVDSRASYVDSQVKGGKTYYYKIVPIQNGWIIGSLAKAKEVKVKTDWLKRPTISVKIKKKKQRQYIEVKLLSFGGKYAQIQVKKGKKYRNITLTKKSISSVQKRYRLGYKKGGITLWVRVRTWQKIGGKKRYSAYSKAKKIRTV